MPCKLFFPSLTGAGYLIYSEADFEDFRPTRCTDVVKFGTEEKTEPNFTPIGATIRVKDP